MVLIIYQFFHALIGRVFLMETIDFVLFVWSESRWFDSFSLVILSDWSSCCHLWLVSLNCLLNWSLLVEVRRGVYLLVPDCRGHWVHQLSTYASWVIPQGVMGWKWSLCWYGWAGNVHTLSQGKREPVTGWAQALLSVPMNYESAFQESFGL